MNELRLNWGDVALLKLILPRIKSQDVDGDRVITIPREHVAQLQELINKASHDLEVMSQMQYRRPQTAHHHQPKGIVERVSDFLFG